MESLFGLPADIEDFTGRRTEVDKLLAELAGTAGLRRAVVISALAGKPGVGKSALAIHVAHRLRDRYPDAQLYVNLRGAESERLDPYTALGGLLEDLGLTGDTIPADIGRRSTMYRAQLAQRRALVVLDNACDEAQVRALMPGDSACAVIVTSRAPLGGLEGVRLHALDVLDDAAAIELLGKIAGPKRVRAELEQAKQIVGMCGGLPLAIRIAAGLLAERPSWTLSKLAARLSDERQRLQELRLGDLEVRASFALSYDELDDDARRVFRRLSGLSGSDFGPGVAAALDDSDNSVAERVLERLADAQMLETSTEDRYHFHDLIALFARERANAEDRADDRALATSRARRWYLHEAALVNHLLTPQARGATGARGAQLEAIQARGLPG